MAATLRTSVYIVDDDASVRRSLARVIRSANLNAVAFASADEFFQSDYETSDTCLVVDAKMPGVSGLDMLARLRKERIAIPAIVVTAHDDIETRKAAEDVGAFGYFRKPFDSEALLDAITWALSQNKKMKHRTD
jgi:FixJ family two-component response regulator